MVTFTMLGYPQDPEFEVVNFFNKYGEERRIEHTQMNAEVVNLSFYFCNIEGINEIYNKRVILKPINIRFIAQKYYEFKQK